MLQEVGIRSVQPKTGVPGNLLQRGPIRKNRPILPIILRRFPGL